MKPTALTPSNASSAQRPTLKATRRPLIIGAALLFGAAGCGDTDDSRRDPDEPASTSDADNNANNGVGASNNAVSPDDNAGTNNAVPLAGDACDEPGALICDADQTGVLRCVEGTWVETQSTALGGYECYNGRVTQWTAGFIGIRSSKRPRLPQPTRRDV